MLNSQSQMLVHLILTTLVILANTQLGTYGCYVTLNNIEKDCPAGRLSSNDDHPAADCPVITATTTATAVATIGCRGGGLCCCHPASLLWVSSTRDFNRTRCLCYDFFLSFLWDVACRRQRLCQMLRTNI